MFLSSKDNPSHSTCVLTRYGLLKYMKESIKDKLLKGYQEASDATGIPVRRLKRMVARRSVRVIKETDKTVMFLIDHLVEDLAAMETSKL